MADRRRLSLLVGADVCRMRCGCRCNAADGSRDSLSTMSRGVLNGRKTPIQIGLKEG